MTNYIKHLAVFFSIFILSGNAFGQKKSVHLKVSKTLPFSAEVIWKNVAEDYGAIANAHPKVLVSNYLNGSLKGGEGVERVCNFNESGSRFLKEKMINYDPSNKTFVNQVYQAGKFPLDPRVSKGVYKVTPISANSCKISVDVYYRTKPAFMGGLVKGSFRKLMKDYFIGIEHYLTTGEKVTKKNFRKIRKKYI